MTASGVDSVCAEATAEMLVDAEVTGMSTHGVSRLSIYMERIQAGIMSPNNNIRIVQEAPSALTVDAGNSLGAAAAKFTMTKCIEKARDGRLLCRRAQLQPLRHRGLLHQDGG